MLSFSAPGIYYGDRAACRDLARRCNDWLAELVARHAPRFGAFAALPFPDIDDCLAEIEYACGIGLDGFMHLTRNDDRPAGHADFREIYRELDRRSAVVLIHPTYPAASAERDYAVPRPIVDYPCETARAAASLLFNGVLAEMPGIRFILSHAGGALPALAHRIGIFDNLTRFREKLPRGRRRLSRSALLRHRSLGRCDGAARAAGPRRTRPDTVRHRLPPIFPTRSRKPRPPGPTATRGFDETARTMMEYRNAPAPVPPAGGGVRAHVPCSRPPFDTPLRGYSG